MQIPENMKFVCTTCPPGNSVIAISGDDETAKCSVCKTQYNITTRFVARSLPHSVDRFRTRYELHTLEDDGGRTRPRIFEAQPSLRFSPNTWVSFVKKGHKLVGVADQTKNVWNPITALPPRIPALATACKIMGAAVVVVAAVYFVELFKQFADFLDNPGAILALLLVLILAAAPVILWTVRTGFADSFVPKRVVPRFRSDDPSWDDLDQ